MINLKVLKNIEGITGYKSKEESKDQESIQSSTTPNPGHHMGR